ncbi:arylamine N-acetyltransferase, partial [Acinetobacter baumannii]
MNAEPYIADVGFGGQTLTGPLRVNTQEPQRTPHEMFRLITRGADYLLQSQIGEGWKTLYRFDLHPQLPVDYEVPNWYLSN